MGRLASYLEGICDHLAGTTTILASTTKELSQFNLDFALDVESVRVNNRPVEFHKAPDDRSELVIAPDVPLADGAFMLVTVSYSDTPSQVAVDGYTGWRTTPSGALAVQEPKIAEWWFPSDDHPTDKATYDVSIAVPDGVEALSNGTLVGKSKKRAGWTRWNWRSTEPQASYLAFLASKFGAYPFHAQGGVVADGVGFALENQTRPVYDTGFFSNGANLSVVVHENAHQWFGDSVALHDWSQIWLDEGFAAYAEFLWSEHVGAGTADELAAYAYRSTPADDPFWHVLPGDPGADNQFHSAVYLRGAMAMHALRTAVGDDDFFRILRTWHRKHGGGDGSIREFIGLSEHVSGQPLHKLFDTWLFTKGKPAVGPNGTKPHGEKATARTATTARQMPESYPEILRTHRLLQGR